LFNKNKELTREAILKMPFLLACSQERTFLHFLASEITGKEKTNLLDNPIKIIRKHFEKQGIEGMTQEGMDLLERALKRFDAMEKKERRGKGKGK